ncbi:MAG: glycosyltransferase [Erysipelotrichaceae bacterium]|nr:glycosyltransferase [Erysipelotrichaceae bacterium]
MKIGQFSDSFLPIVDGVGRVVYSYCDTLSRRGHQCYAVVPLTDMGYRGDYPFEVLDFYSRAVPTMSHYRAGLPLIDSHYHARLEMTDFDIVHLHSPFIAGMEAVHYAKKHKIPLVGTFHSKFYDDFLQITGQEFLAEIGVKGVIGVFNNCDEVWAVSDSSAATLRSYGYKKEIYVIQNGMNKRLIRADAIELAKAKYELNDQPILLYVGQMNWKKNIGRILEACALLHQDGVKFQLLLAGQGPHSSEIKTRIKELGLQDNAKALGHITDVDLLDGLYASAALFVFPSIYDNAPMVVREAANAGTPSIVVRGSNAAEVITDQVNGLLCQDDSQDLFRIIKKVLNDHVLLQNLGKRAQETIPVAWDDVIDEVINRYQNLVDRYKNDHQ